jgi:uncharacterized membrane protein
MEPTGVTAFKIVAAVLITALTGFLAEKMVRRRVWTPLRVLWVAGVMIAMYGWVRRGLDWLIQ